MKIKVSWLLVFSSLLSFPRWFYAWDAPERRLACVRCMSVTRKRNPLVTHRIVCSCFLLDQVMSCILGEVPLCNALVHGSDLVRLVLLGWEARIADIDLVVPSTTCLLCFLSLSVLVSCMYLSLICSPPKKFEERHQPLAAKAFWSKERSDQEHDCTWRQPGSHVFVEAKKFTL